MILKTLKILGISGNFLTSQKKVQKFFPQKHPKQQKNRSFFSHFGSAQKTSKIFKLYKNRKMQKKFKNAKLKNNDSKNTLPSTSTPDSGGASAPPPLDTNKLPKFF